MKEFKDIIKNLPHKPGVYRFYAADGNVLYIGKAKNLKNRVSSYFQEGRPKNERLSLMISQIERIEYTVVNSEEESLILEANLIHNLQPKYNILLKDDKNYVYVRITNDPIPSILLTRRKYDSKSKYFGPYTKRSGIFETLRTLRSIFPYCQERFPQTRPCSYYSIKQCDGMCAGYENIEDYKLKLDQIAKVLSGKTEDVEAYLQNKMKESVELQNFELAGLWRNRLRILKDTVSDQKVVLPQPQDIDLITLVAEQNEQGLQIGSVFVHNIRDGKIINVNNFLLSGSEDNSTGESENNLENTALLMFERFISSYKVVQNDQIPSLIQVFTIENEDKQIA